MQETKKLLKSIVTFEDEQYYLIKDMADMPPFFMNIVSSSNHWMFLSSNGGITAGRKNAEFSLFPYYTDDKITSLNESTGSKTIVKVNREGHTYIWEPFSIRSEAKYSYQRNIYKSIYGNKIVFEEINNDLQLTFYYKWASSEKYGFVKESCIKNNGDKTLYIEYIDGLQNILPFGVPSSLQNSTSNLVNAYKRNELIKEYGLGIFALSAIIVDRAEPSEALKANIAWSVCPHNDNTQYLLSSKQLELFRNGGTIETEFDVKGECGAYFINNSISLVPQKSTRWYIVCDVNKTQSDIISICDNIKNDDILKSIMSDIESGTQTLIRLVGSADGLQCTADKLKDIRHFSNVLFNIMRGGIFADNYQINKKDFISYIKAANNFVYTSCINLLNEIPDRCSNEELYKLIDKAGNKDLKRLSLEYLPLMFSRRHGDPSRPWNIFSINTFDEVTGEKVLDYQGNWRDIFQNWEALAISYPDFLNSMISKFLNATTFEGYNPYRVTKQGFDWETVEPDNPWSYIGYWGDHQIIYLLKLLEAKEAHNYGTLSENLSECNYVFANVPYKIKPYKDIVFNPKDTIVFDENLDKNIKKQMLAEGSDAALLKDVDGDIVYVTLFEKLIIPVLAKLSNYIPEGGIWMNTQRPEWNDANNALVGNGLSMVTLYYMRRYLRFLGSVMSGVNIESIKISKEVHEYYTSVYNIFKDFDKKSITDAVRKNMADRLGISASCYREKIYNNSFSKDKEALNIEQFKEFLSITINSLENSIKANMRKDKMYHSYNLIDEWDEEKLEVSNLNEMLEGQVAALSSGALESEQELQLLDSLRNSRLYREDQNSYILYPNIDLPGFLKKNNVPKELLQLSDVLMEMVNENNKQIIEKDINGNYHFNGNFRNANDLETALNKFPMYDEDKKIIHHIFEQVFNHKAFTGRSGTFFAYEGLGSIYWHMVSKLLLAVQECCFRAIDNKADKETTERLITHFHDIYEGLGVHKDPKIYGAFTTDAYSHTPAGGGARQPGMTGQVKEDIISRFGELGVIVKSGNIQFRPELLKDNEFVDCETVFRYLDINGSIKEIILEKESLAFTYCQVPIIYRIAEETKTEVIKDNNEKIVLSKNELTSEISQEIFKRTGKIKMITFYYSLNN